MSAPKWLLHDKGVGGGDIHAIASSISLIPSPFPYKEKGRLDLRLELVHTSVLEQHGHLLRHHLQM